MNLSCFNETDFLERQVLKKKHGRKFLSYFQVTFKDVSVRLVAYHGWVFIAEKDEQATTS